MARNRTIVRKLMAAALTSAAAFGLPGALAAQEARPELPLAPPGAMLDPAAPLVRIAFGSCNGQEQDQAYWAKIAALDPQLFLMIGDNVYGDTGWDGGADLGSLRAAFALQSTHPEFREFRERVPMAGVF